MAGPITSGIMRGLEIGLQARALREQQERLKAIDDRQKLLTQFQTLRELYQLPPGSLQTKFLQDTLGQMGFSEEDRKVIAREKEEGLQALEQIASHALKKYPNVGSSGFRQLLQQMPLKDLFLMLNQSMQAERDEGLMRQIEQPTQPEAAPDPRQQFFERLPQQTGATPLVGDFKGPPVTEPPLTPEPPGPEARRENILRALARVQSPEMREALKLRLGQLAPTAAQSPARKAGDDLARAEQLYGSDSPQYRAIAESLQPEGPKLTDEAALRSQYVNLSKAFIAVRDSYGRILEATKEPSAAGDVALIFNFMKMLDPGSVVREGEFATAASAGSVPERIWALYNRVLTGERLSEVQREDFLKQAQGQFASQRRFQVGLENQYRGIARQNKMEPGKIIVDFLGDLRSGVPQRPPASTPKAGVPPREIEGAQDRLRRSLQRR